MRRGEDEWETQSAGAQGRRAQGLLLSVAVMQVMQVVQVMQVMQVLQVFYNEAFDHVKRFNYN